TPTAVGPRGVLRGALRLVALPGDANQLLAGTLRAGDRVDVVAALPSASKTSSSTIKRTVVILRDVRVVKPAAQPVAASTTANAPSLSALLALTDADAKKLFYATVNGEWTLALTPI